MHVNFYIVAVPTTFYYLQVEESQELNYSKAVKKSQKR